MDTEQQIRLNFLDEAEDYFDLMESNLLGLTDNLLEAPTIDRILRSAHFVKGGAAMMGFNLLSQFSHRIEDFLKILRVRHIGEQTEAEIETLMLQSVDLMRYIAELRRHGQEVIELAINERSQPIVDSLQKRLGNLESADETALLGQDEDFDPAILIFEEGVEGVLDNFEEQLSQLDITELAQHLSATTEELIGFGHMANLEPFIQLCQSIQEEVTCIAPGAIASLAEKSLKVWRRSHALVLRGSIEKLPSYIEGFSDNNRGVASESPKLDDALSLGSLQSAFTK
ncbi:MAG: Hpt domain-containing protein, partial [Cyanobacteria bacterium J06600_6]